MPPTRKGAGKKATENPIESFDREQIERKQRDNYVLHAWHRQPNYCYQKLTTNRGSPTITFGKIFSLNHHLMDDGTE